MGQAELIRALRDRRDEEIKNIEQRNQARLDDVTQEYSAKLKQTAATLADEREKLRKSLYNKSALDTEKKIRLMFSNSRSQLGARLLKIAIAKLGQLSMRARMAASLPRSTA